MAQTIPVTIRTLLQDFSTAPYGFLDEDILYLLTRLLKDEVINLIYNNEVQSLTSEDTLTKILKREYYDRTIIKIRQKIDIDLINNLKIVARTAFNYMAFRDDEDGMVKDFKDNCLSSTLIKLRNVTTNYNYALNYQYPGKDIVTNSIDLLDNLIKVKDIGEFFNEVTNKKDELIEMSEKIESIFEFFNGMQKVQFDEARKTLEIYDNNRDYIDDSTELKEVVLKMTTILSSKEPYSEIHELPMLRTSLIELLGKMYDVKSIPIIQMLKNTIEYMENEIKSSNLENFGKEYIDTCKGVINTLDNSNELKDIFAQETRVNQLKDSFIIALEKEKMSKDDKETFDNEEKVIPRKFVRTDMLMKRSYEINSKEDVDKYIEELKAKLLKELEENKNITIR